MRSAFLLGAAAVLTTLLPLALADTPALPAALPDAPALPAAPTTDALPDAGSLAPAVPSIGVPDATQLPAPPALNGLGVGRVDAATDAQTPAGDVGLGVAVPTDGSAPVANVAAPAGPDTGSLPDAQGLVEHTLPALPAPHDTPVPGIAPLPSVPATGTPADDAVACFAATQDAAGCGDALVAAVLAQIPL